MTTKQTPIGSGFGAASTAEEVIRGVDLAGKTAIVTGGYSGIGLEAARAFLAAGAEVIVPARDQQKARAALAPFPAIKLEALDLMDPKSIDAFAARFLASGRPLHILLNNAAVMMNPLTRDARGYESQFSANHLGHFQLTARLWPALRNARGARVVSLSSRGHQRAEMNFDDPNFQHRPYDRWQAYCQSKTANALFAVALDRRGEASEIRAFAVHPGAVLTDLARYMTDEEFESYGLTREDVNGPVPAGKSVSDGGDFKTHEQGAATSVWCATSPQLAGRGGVYCEDVDIAAIRPPDAVGNRGVAAWAIDPQAAERLWTLSEELTGVTLPS